jgi:xylulokinase
MPLQRLEGHPGSCLGAAWVAAMGVGATEDWAGASRLVSQGEVIAPNPDHAAIYQHGYRQFRALYERLAPWFAANGQG